MSIRELSRQSGVSHSHIAYIEKGEKQAKESVTKKLADALSVHMEEIMIQT
jgi:transcriptional regulator with XRE-family HTH domain